MSKGKNINLIENEDGLAENERVSKFSREQLLKSKRYNHKRDLLAALLEDGKKYSYADVGRLIKEFSERKVM